METLEAIRARRSVRAFTPEVVPDEHLEVILNAARLAPTAGNQQPWRFLVVRDTCAAASLGAKLEAKLYRSRSTTESHERTEDQRKAAASQLRRVISAPVLIFLWVDTTTYPDLVLLDAALAAENLMLAARAMGYGTSFQTTYFDEQLVREHFGVPERYRLVCTIPLGRPLAWPETPPKRPLEELVWYETYSGV